MSIGYRVRTWPDDQRIITEESMLVNGVVERTIQRVMDLQDKQVRRVLIELGWTPPPETENENDTQ